MPRIIFPPIEDDGTNRQLGGGFSPAFQADAFQTVSHGFNATMYSSELPDGDPRGIDGVADWDSMRLIDDAPEQTLGADLLVNESTIFPATVTAEPGPQKLAHDEMVRAIDALRAEIAKLRDGRMGHNNPPSAIDPPVFTAEQVAALMQATDTLRQTLPAPRAVPDEAREAQKTLKRIFAETFTQEVATQTAQAVGWGLKAGCVLTAAKLAPLLADVVTNADAWIAVVDRVTRAVGL